MARLKWTGWLWVGNEWKQVTEAASRRECVQQLAPKAAAAGVSQLQQAVTSGQRPAWVPRSKASPIAGRPADQDVDTEIENVGADATVLEDTAGQEHAEEPPAEASPIAELGDPPSEPAEAPAADQGEPAADPAPNEPAGASTPTDSPPSSGGEPCAPAPPADLEDLA